VGKRLIARREWLAFAAATAACRKREEGPPVGVTDPSVVPVANASPSATAVPDAIADALEDAPYPSTPPKETIANGELALYDWPLPGDAKLARRAVVLVPTHLKRGERVPLLIALHGLAETANEELGAYAWVKKYGIGDGYAHARAPETITREGLGNMATPARVSELRSALFGNAFRGMVIACPYTPNIWKAMATPDLVLDGYAPWLFDVLLPRLRAETPMILETKSIGLDGVSLGGYASLGIGVRKMDAIGALGCVQAAVSAADADKWSDRIVHAMKTHGPRPLHLLTSTADPFREPVEALSAALKKRSVAHTFRLAIGPHDQPFLRGPGSLEMLLWHDRNLG
jgi:enterochelin esterase-like enzyme